MPSDNGTNWKYIMDFITNGAVTITHCGWKYFYQDSWTSSFAIFWKYWENDDFSRREVSYSLAISQGSHDLMSENVPKVSKLKLLAYYVSNSHRHEFSTSDIVHIFDNLRTELTKHVG